ncbi:hypothetical protein CICLE_v10029934mg [Citrus x clementina]|uniref:Uncharacterized protein n=1 Tax=Citrus clementina TaxID=85681 RepID=V4UEX8_CITCL|nr:hypothetical protein CICLE_v10029934mg [Citrus x clementina]
MCVLGISKAAESLSPCLLDPTTKYLLAVPGAVYVSQSLHFRLPVYIGDEVLGQLQAVNVREMKKRYLARSINFTSFQAAKSLNWQQCKSDKTAKEIVVQEAQREISPLQSNSAQNTLGQCHCNEQNLIFIIIYPHHRQFLYQGASKSCDYGHI